MLRKIKTASLYLDSFSFKGKLEGLHSYLSNNNQYKYVALICHPHPLHGGTMHNKVVYYVHKTLLGFGIPTVRFNFRSVGKSDGQYDSGNGELEDAKLFYNWICKNYPDSKVIVAGFSFGGFISIKLSYIVSPALLISISPAVSRFNCLADKETCVNYPWLVMQGMSDDIVLADDVISWCNEYYPDNINLCCIDGANHFFDGKIDLFENNLIFHVKNLLKL